jgi:hypothetical protein
MQPVRGVVASRTNSFGSFLAFALLGAMAGPMLLSLFQMSRTCYGKRCLDQYRLADGVYQIPGMACFAPAAFFFPSKYDKYPSLAREYFRAMYFFRGDRLIIYSSDQDRYFVIDAQHYKTSPLLIDADFCESNFKFSLT